MAVGSWGKKVVFEVSKKKIFSPNTLEQSVSSRWTDHELIGKKPKAEFLGPSMRTVTMEITLDANLGIKPKSILSILSKAIDTGQVNPLVIGGTKIGSYKWAIESMTETWEVVYSKGQLARAKVSLSLREYR
jgi:hypothetical protein